MLFSSWEVRYSTWLRHACVWALGRGLFGRWHVCQTRYLGDNDRDVECVSRRTRYRVEAASAFGITLLSSVSSNARIVGCDRDIILYAAAIIAWLFYNSALLPHLFLCSVVLPWMASGIWLVLDTPRGRARICVNIPSEIRAAGDVFTS